LFKNNEPDNGIDLYVMKQANLQKMSLQQG